MKAINSMLLLASFGMLSEATLTKFNQTTDAKAATTVKIVPNNFQHTWYGNYDEWTKLTPSTTSIGYQNYQSWLVNNKSVRIYNKNHIRVYSDNMPTFDYKLKYNQLKQFKEHSKSWHLYSHVVGSKATYAFHK